jgi:hypothetical protein
MEPVRITGGVAKYLTGSQVSVQWQTGLLPVAVVHPSGPNRSK